MGRIRRSALNGKAIKGNAAAVKFDSRFRSIAVDNRFSSAERATIAGGSRINAGISAINGHRDGHMNKLWVSASSNSERAPGCGGVYTGLDRSKGIETHDVRSRLAVVRKVHRGAVRFADITSIDNGRCRLLSNNHPETAAYRLATGVLRRASHGICSNRKSAPARRSASHGRRGRRATIGCGRRGVDHNRACRAGRSNIDIGWARSQSRRRCIVHRDGLITSGTSAVVCDDISPSNNELMRTIAGADRIYGTDRQTAASSVNATALGNEGGRISRGSGDQRGT